jgi:hypothetical protein
MRDDVDNVVDNLGFPTANPANQLTLFVLPLFHLRSVPSSHKNARPRHKGLDFVALKA